MYLSCLFSVGVAIVTAANKVTNNDHLKNNILMMGLLFDEGCQLGQNGGKDLQIYSMVTSNYSSQYYVKSKEIGVNGAMWVYITKLEGGARYNHFYWLNPIHFRPNISSSNDRNGCNLRPNLSTHNHNRRRKSNGLSLMLQ